MNFISPSSLSQRARGFSLAVLLLTAACGGGNPGSAISPGDPEAAVRSFMDAVKANNIAGMGEHWGTSRGPATRTMNPEEMSQRLTVMRTFLLHERYEFAPRNVVDPTDSSQRILDVRITRGNCQPVVPFTVVRWQTGWLVKAIDLAAAGNPARPCPAGQ